MADKDIAEKILQDYNDVFADIVNALLFKGKQIVKPESLVNASVKSSYKAENGRLHELERDVVKYWKDGGVSIALLGLENQSVVDYDMALRVMAYDAAGYREQILKTPYLPKESLRNPVITLVLYTGTKAWDYSKHLVDRLNIIKPLKKYVSDYTINVFEIASMTETDLELFHNDYKVFVDYFMQAKRGVEYAPIYYNIKHVDATLKLMSVVDKNENFLYSINECKGKEVVNMRSVLAIKEARSYEKGRAEERDSFATDMIKDGEPANKIMKYTKLSMERLEEIAKSLNITLVL